MDCLCWSPPRDPIYQMVSWRISFCHHSKNRVTWLQIQLNRIVKGRKTIEKSLMGSKQWNRVLFFCCGSGRFRVLPIFIYWRRARGEGKMENISVRGGYSWYKTVLPHMVWWSHVPLSTLNVVNLNWDVLSLVAQMIKDLPAMRETQVWSLGREDSLEKSMATHSSILNWRIPWIRGAWLTTVRGVAKSQTWMSD